MSVQGSATEVAGIRGPLLQNNRRQYFRRYKVLTDSAFDGPKLVCSAPGMPVMYAPYQTQTESDQGAVVVSVEPSQDKKLPLLWWVDVNYDTEYERKDDDPFARPPELEIDFEPFDEPLPGCPVTTYASSGGSYSNTQGSSVDPKADLILKWSSGITNSAGEPFDPPPTRKSAVPVVRFTRNEPNFNVATAVKFNNSVNKSPWSGLEARVAMVQIKAQFQYERRTTIGKPDIPYFKVSYLFRLKRETWDLQLLNIGTYYLSQAATFDADGNLTNNPPPAKLRKTDGGGKPVKVLLAEDGTLLAAGSKPTFRRFRVAPEMDFSQLNLFLNLNIDDLKPKK